MADDKQLSVLVLTDRTQYWDANIPLLPAPEIIGSEFNPSVFEYSAVILDVDNIELKKDLLLRLRGHLKFCLQPIFLTKSIDKNSDALADGVVERVEDAYELAEPICARLKHLTYELEPVLASPLFKVLIYMYVRDKEIVPIKDWHSAAMYAYPEVELLIGFSEQVDDWLGTQDQRGLIEEGVLVDRVRKCPHCGLAAPNYIDVCPNCRSIHIYQESFLHCFTCGAVKPEKEFQTQTGKLICPQCSERLRHIGTDYDRPLENYTCSDCHSTFTEPLIVAICQRCEKMTEPEDLVVKNYRTYALTEKAIIAVKTGHLDEPASLLDSLDNVNFPYFVYLFDWLYSMAGRYKEDEFTIFAIRATNFDEVEDKLGVAHLVELIDEYVKRIKSQLRMTDITAVGGKDDLWFLLPKTNLEGRKVVIERILESKASTGKAGERTKLDLRIAAITIPSEAEENDTSEKIIALIKQELNID